MCTVLTTEEMHPSLSVHTYPPSHKRADKCTASRVPEINILFSGAQGHLRFEDWLAFCLCSICASRLCAAKLVKNTIRYNKGLIFYLPSYHMPYPSLIRCRECPRHLVNDRWRQASALRLVQLLIATWCGSLLQRLWVGRCLTAVD